MLEIVRQIITVAVRKKGQTSEEKNFILLQDKQLSSGIGVHVFIPPTTYIATQYIPHGWDPSPLQGYHQYLFASLRIAEVQWLSG